MTNFFHSIRRCEAGATAIEYGLIVSLIVLAAMVAIQGVADKTIGKWDYVSNEVLTKS